MSNESIERLWQTRPRIISVVVDNVSWILPFAELLVDIIKESGDEAYLCRTHEDVKAGTVAFYLGCINVVKDEILSRNQYNMVVHESDLPEGKGFAPVSWQILEGKNTIPVCLIEASHDVDSGVIYDKDYLRFDGHELNAEIRERQGKLTVEMCMRFLLLEHAPKGESQKGEETRYRRRTPNDSRLSLDKTIGEQFNLLRIVDNERYPAFFEKDGYKYILRIEKA